MEKSKLIKKSKTPQKLINKEQKTKQNIRSFHQGTKNQIIP